MNFDMAFDRLIGNEGKYVNRADDPGGETNWGVTWPKLREAIALNLVPATTTIRDLTRDQAKIIYRELFWLRGHMDEYDAAIAFQVFDAAVNHGMETAVRLLQRAIGVADDGHIGPVTIAAIKAISVTDMLMRFIAERLEFYTKLSTWPAFGRGWSKRCAENLRYASTDV
jgi:lysozyme family protein